MNRTMRHAISTVFVGTSVEFYNFWLSYFAMVWVLPIVANQNLLAFPGYVIWESISPNPLVWLAVYFGIGSVGMLSILSTSRVFNQISTLSLMLLWVFTASSFTLPIGFNTGTVIYGTFAFVGGWNFIRSLNFTYRPWHL